MSEMRVAWLSEFDIIECRFSASLWPSSSYQTLKLFIKNLMVFSEDAWFVKQTMGEERNKVLEY